MITRVNDIRHRVNHYIYWVLEIVLKLVLFLFPRKKNQVLFGAWFGKKYIDNTKYVYEYLLNEESVKVYWYTKEPSIYEQLKAEGKPVVLDGTFEALWVLIRSKLFVSTVQMSEFNPLFLSNCLYLDLGHGHPIKDSGKITWDKKTIIHSKLQKFLVDYHVAYPGTIHRKLSRKNWNTPVRNIHSANFARNDYFFDETLQSHQDFPLNVEYKGKTIVYMPTHRSEGKLPMEMEKILDLSSINRICNETDSVFIIKKHFYHRNEKEELDNYDRIFDLSSASIDPQDFLLKADILITDYSACYVDYLLLNRPLIFYHYDYEQFQKEERSLIIPFEDINIAPKPRTKIDFNESLSETILDKSDIYGKERTVFRKTYYDNPEPHHGREDVKRIIFKLLSL